MHNDTSPLQSQDSDSLLKRLAGPSTTKAGLVKDQTEINRIIAEVSKGSKFYENEKRKDKELTEKINKILKQRGELMKGVDMRQVEAGVDQLIANMEASRDLSQIIVHVDMDAFYASVELLDRPDLARKLFAVGHGVLTTSSYAARKYGVRSGMPEYIAKKLCPELLVIPCNFPRYIELSKQAMDIFRRYDPNMLAAGIDEGYMNITHYCEEHSIGVSECVQQMRDTVQQETKLTVSAGIAPNKLLAKICSDKNKPNGQFHLGSDSQSIKSFMHDLPIRKVPGVGRVNERLLDSVGIKTCGDIYVHRGTLSLMDKQFGLHYLLQTYLGIASNVVEPYHREERKSMGAERTFAAIDSKDKILQKLEEVAAELESDMERGEWTGKTVTLKYKLDTYQVFTRSKSFDRWISTKKEDLFSVGKELLLPELPLRIRLIGLRVTKLKDLRSNVDSERRGIKRFFAPAGGASSPRKRQKLDEEQEHAPSLSQDGYEVSMPGFFEYDEQDHEASGSVAHDLPADQVLFGATTDETKPRPPVSAPARTVKSDPTSSANTTSTEHKPRSASSSNLRQSEVTSRSVPSPSTKKAGFKAPPDGSLGEDQREAQTCPICGKSMRADNREFNAHIDFCLSKGAIMEAQQMASSSDQLKQN